jgi:hypothetical protein
MRINAHARVYAARMTSTATGTVRRNISLPADLGQRAATASLNVSQICAAAIATALDDPPATPPTTSGTRGQHATPAAILAALDDHARRLDAIEQAPRPTIPTGELGNPATIARVIRELASLRLICANILTGLRAVRSTRLTCPAGHQFTTATRLTATCPECHQVVTLTADQRHAAQIAELADLARRIRLAEVISRHAEQLGLDTGGDGQNGRLQGNDARRQARFAAQILANRPPATAETGTGTAPARAGIAPERTTTRRSSAKNGPITRPAGTAKRASTGTTARGGTPSRPE